MYVCMPLLATYDHSMGLVSTLQAMLLPPWYNTLPYHNGYDTLVRGIYDVFGYMHVTMQG